MGICRSPFERWDRSYDPFGAGQAGLVCHADSDVTRREGIVSLSVHHCQSERIDTVWQIDNTPSTQHAVLHRRVIARQPVPLVPDGTVLSPDFELVVVKILNTGGPFHMDFAHDDLIRSRSRQPRLRMGTVGRRWASSRRGGCHWRRGSTLLALSRGA